MALSPRERNMVIFLAVIAVAAAAFFFLTTGGDEPEEAAPPDVTLSPPVSPAPTASPSPTVRPPGRKRPPPLVIVTGRDPFVPLVVAEAGGAGTGTEPAEVGQEPDEPQEPIDTPGPGAEERQQEGVRIGGRLVTLHDVFRRRGEDRAQIEVDGRTFTVSEGERFARNFRVISIEGECTTLLFGDETFRVGGPRQGK